MADSFEPLLTLSPERLAAESARAAEIDAGERAVRRELVGVLLVCWAWIGAGTVCIAWALHATSSTTGTIAMALGLGVGYGGSFFTLVAYYVRGAERGDW
jgi:hypothetical protein